MIITIYFENANHEIEPLTGEALTERLRTLQPGSFTFTARPVVGDEVPLWGNFIAIINENITPV